MRATFLAQLKALLWRNLLLKKRNKQQAFQELLFPFLYVGILIMIRATTKPAPKPPISFPVSQLGNFTIDTTRTLYVVTNGLNVSTVMNRVSTGLNNVPYRLFQNENDALDKYNANISNVAAGIIFGYGTASLSSYAIRMDNIATTKNIFTLGQQTGSCRDDNADGTSSRDCEANTYIQRGFVNLQNAIDQALIEELGFSAPLTVSVQLMAKDEFTPDVSYLQTLSSIYFVLAYSFFVNFLTVNLVAEKEKKIRDGMLMMGLRSSAFWLSWTIVYFVIIMFVTSAITLVAWLGKFFENSNMFIFWLMLMLYGLSIIALSFMLSPFFKKARVAGLVASLFTIILSLIYLAVSQTRTSTPTGFNYSVPPGAQWAMCLLSPVALALAMDQGIFLDVWRNGMTFENFDLGEFPLYAPIVMLCVDVVLYFLLAIYLDHVIPGEYGPRYKPWYFLQKSYWLPKRSGKGKADFLRDLDHSRHNYGSDAITGPNIEPVSTEMQSKCMLRVRDIVKVFSGKEEKVNAVKHLSLDMYEGQITALLGHNGAGKTTLINMLTGVIPTTSGTAHIRGLDVSCSGDIEELRSMCGICPQHNILYDELSVKEHLQIFAGIKGVPSDQMESEVTRAMQSVDMLDQKDVFAKNLSGGQKRKLSVAMALIGDPKIIFLDEPTAGMDPYSRRHLWSLLKTSKEGRLIVLTTHFMDEADILADRKAIISKGQLKCCGSSLYLKSKFGIGYHLNMVVEPSCNAQNVQALLSQHVQGIKFQRSHGKELSYTIPLSQVSNFSNLFKVLESKNGPVSTAQSMGVLSYGVSMPTLEEVFLELGEKEGEEEEKTGSDNPSFNGSLNYVDGEGDRISIEMRANKLDLSRILSDLQDEKQRTWDTFWALMKLRLLLMMRNKVACFFILVVPIGLVIGALLLSKNGGTDTSESNPQPLKLSADLYANNVTGPPFRLPHFLVFDSVGNSITNDIITGLRSAFMVDSYPSGMVNVSAVRPHFVGANLLSTSASNLGSYTALYNDTAIHSVPAIINTMSVAALRKAGSSSLITTFSLPWPSSSMSKKFDNGAFSSSLMVGLAFVIVAASFPISIVQEIQWKCKSQLRIAGVSFHMYWGTTFLFSILAYLITAITCLVITLTIGVPTLTPAGAIVMLILLFIIFIPECLLTALVCSFFFDKYETASAVLPNVFTWIGVVPYLTVSLLDMLAAEGVASALHYVFVFTDPVYIIFGGFYYIDRLYRVSQYNKTEPAIADYFKFENNIIICLIAGLLDMVLMYFLLRILDVRSNGGSVKEALRLWGASGNSVHATHDVNLDTITNEDDDVTQERERVEGIECGMDNPENTVAYVRQVRKEFTQTGKKLPCIRTPQGKVKVAVRNLSFAVNKGEVFGLLGPNGAGKTTALSMMTAEVTPSQGKVVVAGQHVKSNMSSAFQALGFCPQHDALWESIRLNEHLELYAAIKGIHKSDISTITDYFVENLKVQDHRNKRAKQLSGGTKRKLSYAMSMLGNPQIVLLDEPSTGMDPQSKRFLWDLISSSFEGQDRGAILTTHYMEEADALCTRVGIMVNGQLECLGATQHLKSKYGSGYLLEIKLSDSSTASREELEARVQVLEHHLLQLFPGASCLESFAERAQYKIPQTDFTILSATFAALEDTKKSHGVEEYSFSQSTLEQVFLNFAKKQLEEGEDANNDRERGSVLRQLSQEGAQSCVETHSNILIRERL